MFVQNPEAPELSSGSLQGLSASLNAPVVNIEHFPVGPARSAIVLHRREAGALRLSVAVRSLEQDQLAVFDYDTALHDEDSTSHAMSIALSFAESLGFLFDEDLCESGRAGEALAVWRELTTSAPAAAREQELLLDDELPPVGGVPPRDVNAETIVAPPTTLTKFRRSEPPVALAERQAARARQDVAERVHALERVSRVSQRGLVNRLLGCF